MITKSPYMHTYMFLCVCVFINKFFNKYEKSCGLHTVVQISASPGIVMRRFFFIRLPLELPQQFKGDGVVRGGTNPSSTT